jgi:phosphatidylglycerol lysyltransferase
MSLSGAPLARSARPDDTDVRKDRTVDALLGFLGAALEPVYGFQSLHDFKKRFRPETRPLYLAYPDPLALPATALCLARAYAPTMSSRQALSLLSRPAPAAAAQPIPTPEESPATRNARTPAK